MGPLPDSPTRPRASRPLATAEADGRRTAVNPARTPAPEQPGRPAGEVLVRIVGNLEQELHRLRAPAPPGTGCPPLMPDLKADPGPVLDWRSYTLALAEASSARGGRGVLGDSGLEGRAQCTPKQECRTAWAAAGRGTAQAADEGRPGEGRLPRESSHRAGPFRARPGGGGRSDRRTGSTHGRGAWGS